MSCMIKFAKANSLNFVCPSIEKIYTIGIHTNMYKSGIVQ